MATPITVRPGETVRVSGQYVPATPEGEIYMPDGEAPSEYTLTEGDTAPPTPAEGLVWLLVDASRHKDTPPDLPVHRIPGMPIPPGKPLPPPGRSSAEEGER